MSGAGASEEKKGEKTLVVTALGKTGNGKSTLLNRLVKKELFEAGGGSESVTNMPSLRVGFWMDAGTQAVAVVDTPGLLDPQESIRVTVNKIANFLSNLVGVNAFFIVLNGCEPRFHGGEQQVLRALETLLTPAMWKHAIVIFTKCDPGAEDMWDKKKQVEYVATMRRELKITPELPVFHLSKKLPDDDPQFARLLLTIKSKGEFDCPLLVRIKKEGPGQWLYDAIEQALKVVLKWWKENHVEDIVTEIGKWIECSIM